MILKLAALGAIGYFGYKAYKNDRMDDNGAAFADGEPRGAFRNAGADATASKDTMSKRDEALDETFPASDATAKY
ncbi:MAG: hypothetical protein WA936_14050 [Erythrobacter sp.]|uniref:hypothetical protein n=1 Tax=Erythrobacter sp. TaxID=1042 RepID=UPI003C78F71E